MCRFKKKILVECKGLMIKNTLRRRHDIPRIGYYHGLLLTCQHDFTRLTAVHGKSAVAEKFTLFVSFRYHS